MENVKELKSTAEDLAQYFLFKANLDGELISPLRMQKLVYYGYVWPLVINNTKVFSEKIEAWPNGPVVPMLYQKLKGYVSAPIDTKFLKIKNDVEPGTDILKRFCIDDKKILTCLISNPAQFSHSADFVFIISRDPNLYGFKPEVTQLTNDEWIELHTYLIRFVSIK